MYLLVFSTQRNPGEVGSNASEGMDFPARLRASSKGVSALSSASFIQTAAGWCGSDLRWVFPPQMFWISDEFSHLE